MLAAVLSLTVLGAVLGVVLGWPTAFCRWKAIRWWMKCWR